VLFINCLDNAVQKIKGQTANICEEDEMSILYPDGKSFPGKERTF